VELLGCGIMEDMKKLNILIFGVTFPFILMYIYDYFFQSAGNWGGNWFWLEDYQSYFKISFLLFSIVSSIKLITISKKEKNWFWFTPSILLLISLIFYLYMALVYVNLTFP